jgi:hypothetical protein
MSEHSEQSNSRYAVRRTPEPFDWLDRWEVIERNYYQFSGKDRSVSNHFSKRRALRRLRWFERQQADPGMVTSADLPLTDLRAARNSRS